MDPRQWELREQLETELTSMQGLHDALAAEHDALLQQDIAILEQATRRKNDALAAHQSCQRDRLAWAAATGLGPDLSLPAMVTALGGDADLRSLADRLATLAGRSQEANRRNGALILRLQERTRNALQVLRGDSPSGDIYSLSGAREHHVDGKSLGKA